MHTPPRISFKKEFSAGCQPRHPVKIPITTWKSLSPPRGLQLYPSCQARCPVKTSYEMEILTCSICSPTFNDALTSGTSLFLLLLYSIQRKNQQKYAISTFFILIIPSLVSTIISLFLQMSIPPSSISRFCTQDPRIVPL